MHMVWDHDGPVTVRELFNECRRRWPGGDTEAVLSHFVARMDGSESEALRTVMRRLASGRRG